MYFREVYIALFKELGWTNNKVSMMTDDSHGEYAIYHDIMSRKFEEKGIKLAAKILLPRPQYLEQQVEDLDEAYSMVCQDLNSVAWGRMCTTEINILYLSHWRG